jgi:phytoene/squalene synthetase
MSIFIYIPPEKLKRFAQEMGELLKPHAQQVEKTIKPAAKNALRKAAILYKQKTK